jgi:hypothetical protein
MSKFRGTGFRLTVQDEHAMVDELMKNHSMETQNDPVNHVRDWAIDKIQKLHDADRHRNADALFAEFSEWIDLPEGEHEIDYICAEYCES